jgi:signal transduction histidine kinase/CheY-like chemotaxis protein
MSTRILSVGLQQESDVVLARQRARQIAAQLGFAALEQTQIATAVSEIARNAYEYTGGGLVEYALTGKTAPQVLEIRVSDKGKGITNLPSILAGEHKSQTGMGIGIMGAQRLMDQFHIRSKPGSGTVVELLKILPRKKELIKTQALGKIAEQLMREQPGDAAAELRQQNSELLVSLQDLRRQREELAHLNQELQDTNRGVVALYAELDERAEHLRRADELKTRFLSNMSHEFRTPLNSILALTRFLLDGTDGKLGDEQTKQVGFIRRSAENLSELVNDLLDLAKVEAGKTVVRPSEFSVQSLFGALRGMLRPLLVGDAVSMVFEEAPDLPALTSDEGKVSQILRNFISNALKFTEQGEVRVTAAYAAATDTITFSVSDTGIGIAPDNYDAIFQEFTQVENRLQHKYKGTGLGLPLSKRLAELLGGSLRLKSEIGAGSTFSLLVPRIYQAPPGQQDALIAERLEPNRMTIVALDDNTADLAVLQTMLRGSSYQLVATRSIGEARRAALQHRPRALILDVMVGDDFSWDLLAEIKKTPELAGMPILMISALEDAAKATALGADDFSAKPVERGWLLESLDRLVKGEERTRVLVIDDDEVFRYVVRQELTTDNIRVLEAATGSHGLERVGQERFDLVLLDLDLPDISGYEVLARMGRDRQELPPVVVVSGMLLGPQERQRLVKAAAIVPKSEISSGRLRAVMTDVAGGRRAGAAV